MNWKITMSALALGCVGSLVAPGIHEAFADTGVDCPAGVEGACSPHPVGTMVLCSSGKVMGYRNISHYCLSCHADVRPMSFSHPYEARYPESEGFRERESVNADIQFNAGYLTCKSCHAGEEADNHYLVGHAGLANVCNHCHVTTVECPGDSEDPKSGCIPGRVHGKIRCYENNQLISWDNTSAFCVDCHGGLARMSASHPVEIEYPHGRKGFVNIGALDSGVRLEDGRITCESCHLKRDEGMRVCVECHPK